MKREVIMSKGEITDYLSVVNIITHTVEENVTICNSV